MAISNIIDEKELEKLKDLLKKKEENRLFKVDEFAEESIKKGEPGFFNEYNEIIYGPPKQHDWQVSTDDFMSKLTDQAIKDFMKDNFPGLTLEQVVAICKEKYPENYV